MKGILKGIRSIIRAGKSGPMGLITRDVMRTGRRKDMVSLIGRTGTATLVIFNAIKWRELEFITGRTEKCTRASGEQIRCMGRG
jgi:hypothetical protein